MARYRQIAETLEEGIRRGDYVSRLPSVRLLGELFQANSRTVLRALRELSAAGLIVPNGNQGFRIGPQGGGRPETGNIAVFSTGMFQPTGRWNREFQRQFESAGKRLVAIAAPDRGLFAGGKFWETLEVDGVIFLQSSLDRDAAYRLKLSGIPFVAANRMPREWGVNSVDFDHERALRSFLTALVRRGHRRIAMICPRHVLEYFREIIFSTYLDVMDAYAIFHPELFRYPGAEGAEEERLQEEIRTLLALPKLPSAIYSSIPEPEFRRILERGNIRIPDSIELYSARIVDEPPSDRRPGPDFNYGMLARELCALLREVIGNPGRPPESRLIPVRVTGPDGVLLETGDFAGNSRESRKGRN